MASISDNAGNVFRVSEKIGSALKRAADETGVDFDYLVKTAQRESSFRPELTASTSTATGLFQFIEQTWLSIVKSDGARFGLAQEAGEIERRSNGAFVVHDRERRSEILALRKDPVLSAQLAGALTEKNRAFLERSTGVEPSGGDLYLAHFLGASGAADLITAVRDKPQADATTLFPAAAKANKTIFFSQDGTPRTVSDVYAELISKHENTGSPVLLSPDPEQVLASHGVNRSATASGKVVEPLVDAAGAAFLATHFGKAATAFSAGRTETGDAFGAAFSSVETADPSSFFPPRSRYAEEEGKTSASSSDQGASVKKPMDAAPLPSRYGRVADEVENVTGSTRADQKSAAVASALFDNAGPHFIRDEDIREIDLPLDLSQFMRAYEKK